MTQLTLFSRTELTAMRDRTKARNYSPERDAFRRDHKRRRDHGRAQLHARRIYHNFHATHPGGPPPFPPPRSPVERA